MPKKPRRGQRATKSPTSHRIAAPGRTDLIGRFAWNLRQLRIERGVSQETLAIASGVNRSYISRLERQQENPSLRVLGQLAAALGCPVTEFFAAPEPESLPPALLRSGRKSSRAA